MDILVIFQKLNICGTLKFLKTQDHMGLEISKQYTPPTVLI